MEKRERLDKVINLITHEFLCNIEKLDYQSDIKAIVAWYASIRIFKTSSLRFFTSNCNRAKLHNEKTELFEQELTAAK